MGNSVELLYDRLEAGKASSTHLLSQLVFAQFTFTIYYYNYNDST